MILQRTIGLFCYPANFAILIEGVYHSYFVKGQTMKKIILSLSFAFFLTSLPVKANQQAQIERNADEGPAIGLCIGTLGIAFGICMISDLYHMRKKVRELENLPIEYGSTEYTDLDTMKKNLEEMESTKLHMVGIILLSACNLAIGIAKL